MVVGRARTGIQRKDVGGFSLIELIVTVAIITLITVFALPSISSYFQVSLASSSREIAAIVKETYNSAVITGKVHRIVYDLKKQEYWVESGPATMLLDTKETKEKEERRKRFAPLGAEPPPSPFKLERSITRKKIELPRGASFEDVQTEQSAEPITEGLAYTHFFPHGIVEQTVIHLKDESKHRNSLVISAIGGQTDVYERYASAQEILGQQ